MKVALLLLLASSAAVEAPAPPAAGEADCTEVYRSCRGARHKRPLEEWHPLPSPGGGEMTKTQACLAEGAVTLVVSLLVGAATAPAANKNRLNFEDCRAQAVSCLEESGRRVVSGAASGEPVVYEVAPKVRDRTEALTDHAAAEVRRTIAEIFADPARHDLTHLSSRGEVRLARFAGETEFVLLWQIREGRVTIDGFGRPPTEVLRAFVGPERSISGEE